MIKTFYFVLFNRRSMIFQLVSIMDNQIYTDIIEKETNYVKDCYPESKISFDVKDKKVLFYYEITHVFNYLIQRIEDRFCSLDSTQNDSYITLR